MHPFAALTKVGVGPAVAGAVIAGVEGCFAAEVVVVVAAAVQAMVVAAGASGPKLH